MRSAGAYPDDVNHAVEALGQIPAATLDERVFIRLERRRPVAHFTPLGTRVFPVHSWWQAAVVLVNDGDLAPEDAVAVAQEVFGSTDHAHWTLAAQTQDVVRRGGATADTVASIPLVAANCRHGRRWSRRSRGSATEAWSTRGVPDYAGLLAKWGKPDRAP